MAIIYQAVIPLNPKTKKNSQQIVVNRKTGRAMIIQSSEYKEYEKNAGWFLKKIPQPIDKPVNVKCVFYRDSRRVCDLVNLQNAILDILTLHGIISDDNRNIVYSMNGSVVLYDKEKPRTEITIEEVEDAEIWAKK